MKRIYLLALFVLAFALLCGCVGFSDEPAVSAPSVGIGSDSSVENSAEQSEPNGEPPSETASSCAEASDKPSDDTSTEASAEISDEPSDDTSTEVSAEISDEPSDDTSTEVSAEASDEPSDDTSTEASAETSDEPSGDTNAEVSAEISDELPDETSGDTSAEVSGDPPDETSKENEPMYDIGDAELLPSGYLIYNGAAYTQAYYSSENSPKYAAVYARYAELFPHVRISVVNPPASVINITNPAVAAMVNDQGAVLDRIEADIYGDVNFVNLKEIFTQHAGEYLFFKSDYHWTQRGAYYAYYAYALSVGLTPTPLADFEEEILSTDFIGRTNDYAGDERINSFYDTIYAYLPTKKHTMAIYNADFSLAEMYGNCVQTSIKNYSCFITGDRPLTVIEVPENDPQKTVLVIKESSGNAFVPFLTEHYGKIIVIDPRHISMDIRDLVAEQGVDDIIFFATASTSSRSGYCAYYRALIGE